MGSFLPVSRDFYFTGFNILVPHSRNEKADAAPPLVLESNKKSHTTALVMSDEESDAELDRYGQETGRKWKINGSFLRADVGRRELSVAAFLGKSCVF